MPKHTKRNHSKSKKNSKTKKNRPSPSESATSLPEGSIRHGGNGNRWVVKKAANGTPRWVSMESCELNGWKLLTTDHLSKNIGKKVVFYERMYDETWPKKNEQMQKGVFTPNGDLQLDRKMHREVGWLKKQKPSIKSGQMALLYGTGGYVYDNKNMNTMDGFALQIDSKHPNNVSGNVMNSEAFIKV